MWQDLFTALGLVLVIEGAAYALGPGSLQRMMRLALEQSPESLRLFGLVAAMIGAAIVWLARG